MSQSIAPARGSQNAAAPPAPHTETRAGRRALAELRLQFVSPPSDEEVYAYLGRQHRWALVLMQAASLLTIAALASFALRSAAVWGFLALFVLLLATSVVSLLAVLPRRRIDAASHRARIGSWEPERHESVDVFLPTAGEPIAILRNTYHHVAQLQWPGRLEVHVLDDADRPEVRHLAAEFGYGYIVRPDRGVLKKAGNLRHAYSVTSGDQIVIFDADFCPRPDFLLHLMPYMDDAEVGIVQSPQAFETRSSMSWIERAAGSSQELFYRWVQPARDRVGAAICVGTSAIYRRRALESIGGFAASEHSEDMFTGLLLSEKGFETRYVPVVVSKGLCPDTTRSYISQQYRWAMGSLSLLLNRQFHTRRLTLRQRLAHWSGFLFYLSTAVGVFVAELPGIVMLAGFPEDIRPWNYFLLLPALWINVVLLPTVTRSAWRYEVVSMQTLQALTHAVALFDAVRGKSAGWVATSAVGAGGKAARGELSRRVAIVGLIGCGLIAAAMIVAITRAVMIADIALWGLALLIIGAYLRAVIPVFVALIGVLVPGRQRNVRPVRTSRAAHDDRERAMGWPEALAWTSGFLLVIALALQAAA